MPNNLPLDDYMMFAVKAGGFFMVAASTLFVIVHFREPLRAQLARLGIFNRNEYDSIARNAYPPAVENYQSFIPPH